MLSSWMEVLLGLVLLAAAVPVVARIRHPEQKPFAAYLIFITIFIVVTMVLFNIFGALAGMLGLDSVLGETGLALALFVLAMLPAILLAAWQAGKPPMRRAPPD